MTDGITRMEIVEAVGTAFRGTAVGRDHLVVAAREAGARSEVLELLGGLPDGRFREIRDLWIDLSHLPVGV